jgi:hypothetical protein
VRGNLSREARYTLLAEYLKLIALGSEPFDIIAFWNRAFRRPAGERYCRRNLLLKKGFEWYCCLVYGYLSAMAGFVSLIATIENPMFGIGVGIAVVACAVLLARARRIKKTFILPLYQQQRAFVIEVQRTQEDGDQHMACVFGHSSTMVLSESREKTLEALASYLKDELTDPSSLVHNYDLIESLLDTDEDPDGQSVHELFFVPRGGQAEYA